MNQDRENKPVIISGSGRSGTTWVLDGLCAANDRRALFEPLHPACVPGASDIAGIYVDREQKRDDLKAFFDPLFAGNVGGIWIDYRVRTDRLVPSVGRVRSMRAVYDWYLRVRKLMRNYRKYHAAIRYPPIVKMIRANLLLGWLKRNYPYEAVLVLRHPGAVIESMLRLGGEDWDPAAALGSYRKQQALLECFDDQVALRMDSCATDLERYMMTWCLENALPVRQADRDDVHVVFYESLVQNPETEWPAMARHLGLEKYPGEELLSHPSQQAAPGRSGDDYTVSKLGRWTDSFSMSELGTMQELLDIFDVRCYSMYDTVPQLDRQTGVT